MEIWISPQSFFIWNVLTNKYLSILNSAQNKWESNFLKPRVVFGQSYKGFLSFKKKRFDMW